MITKQNFKYQGRVLITRAIVEAPYRMEGIFENEGCFMYFQKANVKMQSLDLKDVPIHKKEAVLLRCGAYYFDFLNDLVGENAEVYAIHLFPEILKNIYADELPLLIEKSKTSKRSKIVASVDVISNFIDSLSFYFENPSLVSEDILELKVKELILLLIQTKNVDSVIELISNLYAPRTTQIKKVIDTHMYSNLSIDDLAKLSNLSLSSFKREFKSIYNNSPQSYINTKKLEKAQALLQNTNLAIGEIAFDIGFNDPQYFTRLFTKNIGITPSDFRSQNSK